jgi:hypothetical protein
VWFFHNRDKLIEARLILLNDFCDAFIQGMNRRPFGGFLPEIVFKVLQLSLEVINQ